ncbi:hypothetical protein [Glaciibacter psychrotolerans]|uniref:Uncharacterized protein n=1 Tax=Glaciibacter psychrotolerans TaxID=670054 RepID=A0A7Z0J5I3_9MICO|nr:hypothetical protein [Leifsonia psychrotolerans]NYJ19176.1 hypothetical protein [Leifsonia psychrotolerans]
MSMQGSEEVIEAAAKALSDNAAAANGATSVWYRLSEARKDDYREYAHAVAPILIAEGVRLAREAVEYSTPALAVPPALAGGWVMGNRGALAAIDALGKDETK